MNLATMLENEQGPCSVKGVQNKRDKVLLLQFFFVEEYEQPDAAGSIPERASRSAGLTLRLITDAAGVSIARGPIAQSVRAECP